MNSKTVALRFRAFMIILFLISALWAFYNKNWLTAFSSLVIIIILIFSKKLHDGKNFDVSSSLYIIFLLFLFLSTVLGEIGAFYYRIWWWDLFLHINAGIILGLLGFALTYSINENSEKLNLNPFYVAFFGFCFSVTISVFWEFFEFVVDFLFKTNMLKSGLLDTFGDLAIATLGAVLVSLFGYWGLKRDYKKMILFFKGMIIKHKKP